MVDGQHAHTHTRTLAQHSGTRHARQARQARRAAEWVNDGRPRGHTLASRRLCKDWPCCWPCCERACVPACLCACVPACLRALFATTHGSGSVSDSALCSGPPSESALALRWPCAGSATASDSDGRAAALLLLQHRPANSNRLPRAGLVRLTLVWLVLLPAPRPPRRPSTLDPTASFWQAPTFHGPSLDPVHNPHPSQHKQIHGPKPRVPARGTGVPRIMTA
jgi:hypothetical protein